MLAARSAAAVGRGRRLKLALARRPRLYRWAVRCRLVARLVLRRVHEPDFRALRRFRERPGLWLDVGANIGQSAVSFRVVAPRAPIVSIEANPTLAPDLRFVSRLVRHHTWRIVAASDAGGTIAMRVPVVGDLVITGEAAVEQTAGDRVVWARQMGVEEEVRFRTITVSAVALDDLDLAVAVVKLDLEGHELLALRGLARTIERHRPIVMAERNHASGDVARLMEGWGYERRSYVAERDDLVPEVLPGALNDLYLPEGVD